MARWARFVGPALVGIFLFPSSSLPRESAPVGVPGVDAVPRAAELVARAAGLSQRLTALRGHLGTESAAASETKDPLNALQRQATELSSRLAASEKSKDLRYDQAEELRREARKLSGAAQELATALSERLGRLSVLEAEWSAEKARWAAWEESWALEGGAGAARPAFDDARRAIGRASTLLSREALPLMDQQRRASEVQAAVQADEARIEALLDAVRHELLRRNSPPLFSGEAYAAFVKLPSLRSWVNLARVRWPDRAFFASEGWVVFLQAVLAVGLAVVLHRHPRILVTTERWEFLGKRRVAAAVFLGVSAPTPLYGFLPTSWSLLLWAVAAPAAARLLGGLIALPWKRRLLYGLAGLFLLSQFFRVLAVPDPVFRAYVTLVAAVGLPLTLWRATESARRQDHALYTWALRLGGLLFAAVLAAEIIGYSALALQLFEVAIKTTFLVLLAWVVARLARGAIDFGLGASAAGRFPIIRDHREAIGARLGVFTGAAVTAVTAGALLQVWRVFDTPWEAVQRLLSLGGALGTFRVTLGAVLAALFVLYVANVISWAVQRTVDSTERFAKTLEPGARISINRLIHYALVLVGVALALATLGVELRNVTIVAGALGVGIGFGLQNIVNNFVSGLILLFERPIKVGDVIQVGGEWGQVKRLGLRSAIVQTFDQSEIIVPNSNLIANPVTNWTLSDRQSRIVVEVGVAYGSDVPEVLAILEAVARDQLLVLPEPEPQVFFTAFGESSLSFELRVWVGDVNDRLRVKSDVLQEIDRRFREAGVEIPFPQRDVHLRGAELPGPSGVAFRPREEKGPGQRSTEAES